MDAFVRDRIARLRWHGGGDALAARRAAERSLEALEWGPGGSAILCVRRLRGTRRSGRAVQTGRPWREQLQALAAEAARPWREPVPADARAVLFADEAELLACLARDAASGAAAAAWWWPPLLGAPAGRTLLLRRWREAPALVPQVLRRLARRAEVGPVLLLLGEAEIAACTEAVAQAFAIDLRVPVAASQSRVRAAAHGSVPPALASDWNWLRHELGQVLDAAAPARTPAAARLLSLSLALAERPRLARAPGFAAALHALAGAAPAAVQRPEREHTRVATSPAVPGSARPPAAVPPVRSAEAVAHAPVPVRRSPLRAAPSEDATNAATASAPTVDGPRSGATAATPPAHAIAGPRESPGDTDASPPARAMLRPPAASLPGEDAPLPALRVRSAFAGTSYLLPLAIHLGWYGDFTQPRHAGLALHPADLLALLGERAAGDAWRTDALPALLAAWAGRAPDEPAGVGFDPGMPLSDWLAARERDLVARAAPALGWPAAQVLPRLVRREGVVRLDAGRLDVHFDLAAHPLDIRIAGLDRDLGWVPAAGRTVAFHFDLGLPP